MFKTEPPMHYFKMHTPKWTIWTEYTQAKSQKSCENLAFLMKFSFCLLAVSEFDSLGAGEEDK